MPQSPTYLQLKPGASPPEISIPAAISMVVAVEAEVSPAWQAAVSNWIVRSGCIYMMAWGIKCSSWDDSVDIANLEKFGFEEIPDDHFVMTTWHSDETLEEVFWFAKNRAYHPTMDIDGTVLLHVSSRSREREFLAAFDKA